ncbi:MAG: replication-relaxation family protein [Candidatus Paceibacterota bacterium]
MMLVAEFRFLSREQLQLLLDFPCVTRINIRLKKLFEHRYLSRLLLPTIIGRPKALYYLGHQGIITLSESLCLDPLPLGKERKHLQERKDLFLNHQLFLNEVRIAFTLAIKKQPHRTLERWIKERDCLIEFLNSRGRQVAMRPDGCLCLNCRGRRYSFFIEVDCSTMTNSRLKAKAQAYLDYARADRSGQDFGFNYFRVLIITRTEARLANLKATIEELSDRIFYFAVRDDVCQEYVLDRIWQRAGRQGLFSLLEN